MKLLVYVLAFVTAFVIVRCQILSADEQCRNAIGSNDAYFCRSEYYSDSPTFFNTMCSNGQCFNPASFSCEPATFQEFTTCGQGKWCEQGICVVNSQAPSNVSDLCPQGENPNDVNNFCVIPELPGFDACSFSSNAFKASCCEQCIATTTTSSTTTTTTTSTPTTTTSTTTPTTITTTPTSTLSTTTPTTTTSTPTTTTSTTTPTTTTSTTTTTTSTTTPTTITTTPTSTLSTTTPTTTTSTTTPTTTTSTTTPTTTTSTTTLTTTTTRRPWRPQRCNFLLYLWRKCPRGSAFAQIIGHFHHKIYRCNRFWRYPIKCSYGKCPRYY